MIQELFEKEILIFGCGNTLMGDDGFGPAVAASLKADYPLPDNVMVEDMGTSISDFLFDLILSGARPEQIWILDAVYLPCRRPGELFEMTLDLIPDDKNGDFCMHQFPGVNLLSELSQKGIRVRIMAAQMKQIPDKVLPGLSPPMAGAVPKACDWVMNEIKHESIICQSK